MTKDLTAQRFAGVTELEAALDDTTDSHVVFDGGGVLPRSKGPHVRVLQESLLAMGFALPRFGADSDYGSETKDAVTAFQIAAGVQRRPDRPDHLELIDGKVGRDTMGLFDMFDPGPTVGSFTSIQTGVPAASVALVESPEEMFSGFDGSGDLPALVVGTRTRRRVQVLLDPGDAEVDYVVDDPAVASVVLTADGIVVTGEGAGTTLLRAQSGGVDMSMMEVVVKDQRTETVNFFFMMDSANPAHASNRVVSQAVALTSRLNRVWRRQANVQFTLGQAREVRLPVALGDVVQGKDAFDFASQLGVPGELNVVFVWEFEPIAFDPIPGFPIIDVDGTTIIPDDPAFPTLMFLDDDDCADLLTVAHEAGHFLGFRSNQHPPTGIMSVCHGGIERPRVSRTLADLVNP